MHTTHTTYADLEAEAWHKRTTSTRLRNQTERIDQLEQEVADLKRAVAALFFHESSYVSSDELQPEGNSA